MDDGHEAFDLDQMDFENAMNPGQRNYRRQTKEQATYGILEIIIDGNDLKF